MTLSQWISVVLLAAGALFWASLLRRPERRRRTGVPANHARRDRKALAAEVRGA
jgi:hypothetical protein